MLMKKAPSRTNLDGAFNILLKSLEAQQTFATCTTLSAELGSALRSAWLFVELADAHLFFNAASLNQLAETSDCLLGRFFVAKRKLDHVVKLSGWRRLSHAGCDGCRL